MLRDSRPAPRILGYEVAGLTVAKYMRRLSPRPSAPWRTFLEAHTGDIVAVDCFVVPTPHLPLAFRMLAAPDPRIDPAPASFCYALDCVCGGSRQADDLVR